MSKTNVIIDLDGIPEELNISTVSLTCNIETEINTVNIVKFMTRSEDIYITPGKHFYNQVTLICHDIKNKNLNIKLFNNGSIQITGCKSVEHFTKIIVIVFELLKEKKILFINNKIVTKTFVNDISKLNMESINKFKITLINSNMITNVKIDRPLLYGTIKKLKTVPVEYDSCRHAAVRIYLNTGERDIAIFVFESGAIIITGAKNKHDLNESFKFIIKTLYNNFRVIVKVNIDTFLQKPEIQKFLESYH